MLVKDKEAIAKVFNHPAVYNWITDDCSPEIYEPDMDAKFIYLMDDTKNGVVRLDPINSICCQAHIALTPKLWGSGCEFVRDVIAWGVKNTLYMKVIVMIPAFNKLTIRLVEKIGFSREGVIKKSFLKNWKLYDQELWGLTKTDFIKEGLKCQEQ